MKLDRDTYLLYNKELNTLAKECGVDYCRQYSYNGMKVRRTKFWAVARPNTSWYKKKIKNFISKAKKLSYVADAFIYEPYKCSPLSVKIIYN